MQRRCPTALVLLALTAPLFGQSLDGMRVVISPGHGYYWHSTLGWTTQRPLIDGLIEDIHTNEIVMDYLLGYLEGAGARAISCRARSRTAEEYIVDNDDGFPAYQEAGTWSTSASAGWGGSSYRFATGSPAGGSLATFRAAIQTSDEYPVYVAYLSGPNRSSEVEVQVVHAGGLSVRTIDQTRDGLRWVYVGKFPFRGGEDALITISNQTNAPGVVIADAVRIGDGFGSIVRGSTTSGQLRWRECSRYHAQYFGAPSTVWNPVSGGQDNSDDVTCRPFYAEWWGADLFLSLHTNAGGGSGTSTWIHNTSPTAGSAQFQSILHSRLITDIRAGWNPAWQDDGTQSANFGEVRELSTMPGVLVELAFHDDIGGDIEALHHPRFRRIAARALYRGIASYLGAQWVVDPPQALAMTNDGLGNLVLKWSSVPGATSYRVRLSDDGFGYDDGQIVTGTNFVISGLTHGDLQFAKVAVVNGGGTGPDSQTVGARLAPGSSSPLLLVDGFDRLDRFVREHENRHDGLIIDGGVIDAITTAGYPFDGATNEGVTSFLTLLASYRCVGWILGEESTADETFASLEQAVVSAYLNGGGSFFFSGAEVGWDLDNLGSASDRVFYETILGQDYVADDAGIYFTMPQTTGPLAPLPVLQFDDGTNGTYDVDFPDVVQPAAGTGGQIVLRYLTGAGAAVLHGNGRVLGIGFPIETVVGAGARAQLMERILERMCPLPIEPMGPLVLGTPLAVALDFPGAGGSLYGVGASFSPDPGTPLGDGRVIPLNADAMNAYLFDPFQTVFTGIFGNLNPAGQGQFQILIPNIPLLSGFSWVMCAVTVNLTPFGFDDVSPWRRFVIP